MKSVSDDLVEMLFTAGIRRMYGIVGDSLNPVMEALHDCDKLHWINVRHEETGAFAACAEAQLTGKLAACCGSCGPGNMHLVNGLYDAHRSGVPVFALACHIPQSLIGSDYFQETHPTAFFAECTRYCELVSQPEQSWQVFGSAIRHAIADKGVGMVVLPGDVAAMKIPGACPPAFPGIPPQATLEPSADTVRELADRLNETDKVVFFCGEGCRGGREAVLHLARRLRAPVAYTMRAKDFMERDNPNAIGMTGLLGWGDAPYAIHEAELLVMWGTDFPFSCFLPEKGNVVQVDVRADVLGRRVPLCQAVVGDAGRVASLLLPLVGDKRSDEFLSRSLSRHGKKLSRLQAAISSAAETTPIRPEYVTRLVSDLAEPDAVFTVDTGTPVIWAARFLQAQGTRRIIGSYKHGSMACALAMAIGAKAAYPSRQVIALCGDGGLGMLPGDILTLLQEGLSVKIFVYNNSALDFVAMEQAAASMQPKGTDLQPTDFAAIARAMGIGGIRLDTPAQAPEAIRRWLSARGPALLDVAVDPHALAEPPNISVLHALGCARQFGQRVLHHELDAVKHALFGNRRLFKGV